MPAGLANVAPVFATKIPLLKDLGQPLDFGKHFRGKRILGDNKTWRGLLLGIFVGSLTAYVQYRLWPNAGLDIDPNTAWAIGGLMGLGALLGDGLESFFKRQSKIAPGESWFPFDQLDYVFGGLAVLSLVTILSLKDWLMVIIVWFVVHLVSVYVGFLLNVRDKPI